ncbi:MAG: spore cortex biosynthesis protein YabQ [Bacillota bacterium]
MEFESGFFVFAVMAMVGCISGFLYDLIRALESPLRLRGIVIFLVDLVFWLTVAGLVSAATLLVAGGELRMVFVAAAVLGALVYFIALSPRLLPPMRTVTMTVHRSVVVTARRTAHLLGFPVRGAIALARGATRGLRPLAARFLRTGLFSGTERGG